MNPKRLTTRFFLHPDGRQVVISYPDLPGGSSARSVYYRDEAADVAREARFETTVQAVVSAMARMRTLWARGYRPANADGSAPRESAAGDAPRVTWYSERRAGTDSVLTVDVLTTRPEQFVLGAIPDWFDGTMVPRTETPRRITKIDFLPRRPSDGEDDYRLRLELTGTAAGQSFAALVERLSAEVAGTARVDWPAVWSALSAAGTGATPAAVREAFASIQRAYRDHISDAERQRRIAERAAEIAAADAAKTQRTEAAVRAEVERIRTERDFGTTQRRINLDE